MEGIEDPRISSNRRDQVERFGSLSAVVIREGGALIR
jgi:hypothetical protein